MAFLGVIKALRGSVGAERIGTLVAQWGDELRTALARRIDKGEWYPYAAFAQLLAGADAEIGDGKGSLCVELGHAAAKNDLSGGAFAVLRMLASPRHLIGSCERVWPRYYRDAGRMEAVSTLPERTVLRIHDFPTMAPEHCRMMEGWMISAMSILGATVMPGARESRCTSLGAPYHEFTCAWSR